MADLKARNTETGEIQYFHPTTWRQMSKDTHWPFELVEDEAPEAPVLGASVGTTKEVKTKAQKAKADDVNQ